MPQTTTEIVYPESDGAPLGENTLQVQWIIALMNGFQAYFRDRADAFVAADLFWYPVEGEPTTVTAPDVMIAFGRPKGHRPSYKQWEERGVAPQVVFEVLSPSNTMPKRRTLAKFYERHGVEEFYEYDPDRRVLTYRLLTGKKFGPLTQTTGHTSARLGVRFEVPPAEELRVIHPDGTPFRSYLELLDETAAAQDRIAEEQRSLAVARAKADRLAAKLRELGLDPDAI